MSYSTSILIWLKKNRDLAILITIATLFFFIYSYPNMGAPLKFNSPDEGANYFFSQMYAEKGELRHFEQLNEKAQGIIHPRAISVKDSYLVPGSFLGMNLLYGTLAKFFGLKIITYLTPLFSVLAVLFFYGLLKRIFTSKIAFLSGLFLLIHPAFWYYSSRGMFHNVLFVALLIIGSYWLISATRMLHEYHECYTNNKEMKWGRHIRFALAMLFIGLALIVRTSEIWWIGITYFILFLNFREHIKWQYLLVGFLVLILIFIPIFYYNKILYGNPLSTGYPRVVESSSLESVESSVFSSRSSLSFLSSHFLSYLFPFGVHPISFLSNFCKYYIWIFWWYFVPFVVGFTLFIKNFRKKKRLERIYLTLFVFISLWLVTCYGSWVFYDNPDPREISIGTSYVRYWLPIYILSLPFVSFAFLEFSRKVKKVILDSLLICCFVALSFYLTLWGTSESLAKVKDNIVRYKNIERMVETLIPSQSVIISERADKIFFPHWRVISLEEKTWDSQRLQELVKKWPVYYYSELEDKDVEYINQKKLKRYKLRITQKRKITEQNNLYKLILYE